MAEAGGLGEDEEEGLLELVPDVLLDEVAERPALDRGRERLDEEERVGLAEVVASDGLDAADGVDARGVYDGDGVGLVRERVADADADGDLAGVAVVGEERMGAGRRTRREADGGGWWPARLASAAILLPRRLLAWRAASWRSWTMGRSRKASGTAATRPRRSVARPAPVAPLLPYPLDVVVGIGDLEEALVAVVDLDDGAGGLEGIDGQEVGAEEGVDERRLARVDLAGDDQEDREIAGPACIWSARWSRSTWSLTSPRRWR